MKAAEVARKISKAFGEEAVSIEVTRIWFCRFQSGNESTEEQLQGYPETCTNEKIKQNPRAT